MVNTALMCQGGEAEKALANIVQTQQNPGNVSLATKANPFTADKNLFPLSVNTTRRIAEISSS